MDRVLNFNINSDKLNAGLRKVDGNLEKTERQGNKTTDSLAKGFKIAGIAITAAAAATTAVLTKMISSSLASGDALAKMADKVGISTEALSTLNYQASLFTNAGAGAMAEALTKASKRLGEFNANGGGASSIWLKKLNLDVKELSQLSPDQLFNKYADSVRGLSNRHEQLAAMSALFGDESRNLIGIVDASSEAMAEAAADAEMFGINLSRVDASKMEMVNDSMTRVKGLFTGLSNQLTTGMAPLLNSIIKLFTDSAREAGGFGDIGTKVADGLITGFGFLADAVNGLHIVFKIIKVGWVAIADVMLRGIKAIAQGFIDLNNTFNPFGGRIDDFTALDGVIGFTTQSVNNLTAALHEAAMAPPPSVAIGNIYEEEKNAFNAQAQQNATDATNNAAGGGGDNGKQAAYDLAIEQELAQIDIMLGLKSQYEEKALEIATKAAERKRQIDLMALSSTASALGSMSTLLSSAGKKQTTASKIFAKASILTSTAVAIMKAWELPWPANIPAIAAAGLAGATQLAAIGSGGSGSGISSPTNPVSSNPQLAATPIATPTQTTAAPRGETVIQFTGNFTGWNDQVIDDLAAAIASAVDDRDVRIISPTSRNAQDLAVGY